MKDKLIGAWRSFTIWINMCFIAVLPLYESVRDAVPELRQYMPDNSYKWVGLAVVVINIGLRFKTNCDLSSKRGTK